MVYRAGHSLERCQGHQGAAHILPISSKATRKAVVAPPLHLPMKAQTHPYTGVSNTETHPYTGVFSIEALPKDVQILLHNLGGRPSKQNLRATIQKLCGWRALTAQQLIELLHRKDKKHFVRSHLTPMIKEGSLKYLFPADEDSPNQAYLATQETSVNPCHNDYDPWCIGARSHSFAQEATCHS